MVTAPWFASIRKSPDGPTLRKDVKSRRILRALNKAILSLPNALAYRVYDQKRHWALMRRYAEVFPNARAETALSLQERIDVEAEARAS